jgi:hypothetical protein
VCRRNHPKGTGKLEHRRINAVLAVMISTVMTHHMKIILAAIFLLVSNVALAQEPERPPLNPYGSGQGLQVLLTNSGFGLGAYLTRSVSPTLSFQLDASLGTAKDEREARFFRFGSSFVPGKANYLMMMPFHAGFSRRMFRHAIEDNFRPYVQLTGGPTFGWQYPYFSDCDGTGNLNEQFECPDGSNERVYGFFEAFPKGEVRMGAGATIAIGAFFGDSERITQGIRIGYAFHYFFDGVQLMERRIEETPRKVIGSPTITLSFGRLITAGS